MDDFKIFISADARLVIERKAVALGITEPLLLISRQGPVSDLKRGATGEADWKIQRPHPWQAQVSECFLPSEDPDIL